MCRYYLLILITCCSSCIFAQEVFTELELPGKAESVQGMMIGSDIFLTMRAGSGSMPQTTISFLVHPDGSNTTVDLSRLGNNPLIAGIRENERTAFYYLDVSIPDQPSINCFLVDKSGNGEKIFGGTSLPGKIYGSYSEGENLYVLCALKKEYTLRLLGFHSGTLISEKTFPLSFDLGKRKESIVSFFETDYTPAPRQASGFVKLIKDGQILWIIVDEPPTASSSENTGFKTTVVKLDLGSSESTVKTFFEPEPHAFTSYLYKENLYRLVNARIQRVDQFDFNSGKKVKSATLNRGKESGRDSTYARIGGRVRTEKDVKGANIVKRVFGHMLIVDSLNQNEQLLTVGHYGDHMFTVVGFTNIVAIAASISSLLVGELVEGPISVVYSYYHGTMETGFTASYASPYVLKRIDDYEYWQLVGAVRYEYRGYLNQPEFVYAIYQRKKSNKMEILKFKR
jgi:hypothetical protein